MSPSWSTGSGGKKYRYCVSQAIIRKELGKVGKVSKVSLPKLEQFIDNWFSEVLKDKTKIYPYIQQFGVSKQKEIIKQLSSYPIVRDIEKSLIKRVQLHPNKIEITLYQEQLTELLNSMYENRDMIPLKLEKLKNENTYTETYRIGTVANGAKVIVGQFVQPTKQPNKELITILHQAYTWHQEILDGKTTQEIANREKVCVQYVRRILNLSFLSPKIVCSILNGTQPVDCTLKKLIWIDALDWPKQNKLFFDKFF